jgi:hypothetical protein
VEYDLAILIVSYLSFPGIDKAKENWKTEGTILQGYFSFYEYAVSSWIFHLEAGISAASTNDLLNQLTEPLGVFLELHWTGSSSTVVASKTVQEKFQLLKEYDFHSKLLQAVVSTRKQLGRYGLGPSDEDVLDISLITAHFRAVLESLVSNNVNTEQTLKLKELYGPNLFKCPRINCQYFYKGFAVEEHRNQHVARHDRAFLCSFEGCPTATFGCATSKELEDHMLHYHGTHGSDALEFPDVPKLNKNTQIHPSTYQCTQCPKRFTRAHNLRNHERSHRNEKPFVCNECQKSFARGNDLRRHQQSHSEEKIFVCRGPLESGGEWGCGLRFSRRDTLDAHHKNATGARCIKPLREQDAEI